jgi:hypothetical protein
MPTASGRKPAKASSVQVAVKSRPESPRRVAIPTSVPGSPTASGHRESYRSNYTAFSFRPDFLRQCGLAALDLDPFAQGIWTSAFRPKPNTHSTVGHSGFKLPKSAFKRTKCLAAGRSRSRSHRPRRSRSTLSNLANSRIVSPCFNLPSLMW